MRNLSKKVPEIVICLSLVVTTIVVFGQIINHDFVYFDDNVYVIENKHVKAGLGAKSALWALSTTHAEFWHPLTWLSLMLDTQLFGFNPSGYLFTNLLLHVCSTLLIFAFFNRTSGKLWQSGFVAALFALHPLHVESVAWIAQRKDVLSTFFWMLTMVTYFYFVQQPALMRYLLVLLFFSMGLMAKPMLITLPFVLLLMDFWPLRRLRCSESPKLSIRSVFPLVQEKIPLFIIAAASSFVTFFAQQAGGGLKSLKAVPLIDRIINALVSYISYLGKMIWPQNLTCFYPYHGEFPWWQSSGSLMLLVLISVAAIKSTQRHPYFITGWLWYLGTLVPVIGFVKIGDFSMADRYTYVPIIGIFVVIAWGVPDLLKRWRHRKPALTVFAIVVLFSLMVATWTQVGLWKSSYTLFEHCLKVTSNNYLAHNSFALALKRQGNTSEAVQHFREALRINPRYAKSHYNLANTLEEQGKTAEAIKHHSEALRIDPNISGAHNNLGIILEKQGNINDAIDHFRMSLRINADDEIAHYNLGNALAQIGDFDGAEKHYHETLRINPDNADAHYNLGIVFEKQGKMDDAIKMILISTNINPDFAEAYYSLGNLMVKKGRIADAIMHYQKARSIQPDNIEVLNNLAFVYAIQKDYENAVLTLKKLTALQPDNSKTYYNLASLYALQNNVEESIKWLRSAIDKGYKNWVLIKTDKDLDNIRSSAEYKELIKGH